MGWTHYWKRESQFPEDAFEKAARDSGIVCAATGIPLRGPESKGQPVFSSIEIAFNGTDGQDCESFSVRAVEMPRRAGMPVFSYCKTEKLPYDLCVKCSLIVLNHYLGNRIQVMSDGSDEEWDDAKRLCHSYLGYGTDFRLTTDNCQEQEDE